VAGAILAVVIAIDLATNFERVMAPSQDKTALTGVARLWFYAWLRVAYNLPAVLPLAAAIGIVLAEHYLAQGQERAAIFDTGRSRLWSLMPALLCAMLVGGLQQAAVAQLRPYAEAAQIDYGFRNAGAPMARQLVRVHWRLEGQAIVMASFDPGADATLLRDVIVFGLDDHNRVATVWVAPSAKVGADLLTFDLPPNAIGLAPKALPPLQVNAAWLSAFGIAPRMLTTSALQAIVDSRAPTPDLPAYQAAFAARQVAWAEPLALCLMAATLSLVLMRPRQGLIAPLVVVAAVYAESVLAGIIAILAEFGVLPAAAASRGPPFLLVLLCLGGLALAEWRINRQLASVLPR